MGVWGRTVELFEQFVLSKPDLVLDKDLVSSSSIALC